MQSVSLLTCCTPSLHVTMCKINTEEGSNFNPLLILNPLHNTYIHLKIRNVWPLLREIQLQYQPEAFRSPRVKLRFGKFSFSSPPVGGFSIFHGWWLKIRRSGLGQDHAYTTEIAAALQNKQPGNILLKVRVRSGKYCLSQPERTEALRLRL